MESDVQRYLPSILCKHDCEFGFFIPHCLDVDRLFSFGGDGISVWDVKDERRLVGMFYLGRGVVVSFSLLYDEFLKVGDFVLLVFWQSLCDVCSSHG